MVLRLCLCTVLLFACGYANKASDYCRVLVNYDTFKTSVDQFLASWGETCGSAGLTPESTVDCGSPPPTEGAEVVFNSTGPNAMANYKCNEGFVNIHPGQQMMSLCQKDGNWTMVNVQCVNLSSCSTTPAGRVLYTGTRSTTITGKVCQRWSSQYPHTHTKTEDVKFWIPGFDTPQTVTGSANYCRDPDRDGFLWCYTTDRNSRWEKCDVPKCNVQD